MSSTRGESIASIFSEGSAKTGMILSDEVFASLSNRGWRHVLARAGNRLLRKALEPLRTRRIEVRGLRAFEA